MGVAAAEEILVAQNAVIAKLEAEIFVLVAAVAFSLFEGLEGAAGDAHEGTFGVDALDEELDCVHVVAGDVFGLKIYKNKI